MDLHKMLKSFTYAGKGFEKLLKSENNFQFHALAGILALGFAYFLSFEMWEWLVVLTLIALLFMAEAFNTAIEKLCDLVSEEWDERIGSIKDIAAAGVLIVAILAFIVACVLYLPKIFNLING